MLIGMLLVILGGIFMGLCFFPMRFVTEYAWENIWFLSMLFSCLLFPPLIAFVTIPSLFTVLSEVGLRLNVIMLATGLVAGVSGICVGRAVRMVGITLMNSLSNGMALIVGSFVPLIVQHPEALHGKVGFSLFVGLGLGTAGVITIAVAGSRRKEASAYARIEHRGLSRKAAVVLAGIALSVISGLLTPLQNIGIAFGDAYMRVARSYGASEAFMTFAFYVPYLGTSFVSNAAYCAYLWRKNGSLRQFRAPGAQRLVLTSICMAVLFVAGMMFYGWAMPHLGTFGPVIGWPVALATMNLASAAVEYSCGDWKGQALRVLCTGLLVLTLSIVTFAYADWLIQNPSAWGKSWRGTDCAGIAALLSQL